MNNGSGGKGESNSLADYHDEAIEVWRSVQKQISKVIQKIIHFNSSYEYEDYQQEAFIACLLAVRKYRSLKGSSHYRKTRVIKVDSGDAIRTNMRIDVFAYWYIQKRLYKIADTGEVVFNIFNKDNRYVTTLSNSEYRRKRKEMEKEGLTANSTNLFKDLEFFKDDGDNSDTSQDFADVNFMGFNKEIQDLLKEDIFKYDRGLNCWQD